MKKDNIEVEIRGIFSEDQYKKLIGYLDANSTVLGPDDRETIFFIIPDKTLKVAKALDKGTAKIALKIGNIKSGEQEEIEMSISPDDFNKGAKIFELLGFTEIQHTFQKRRNYLYKDAEIAVKYSEEWSYHWEMDTVVDSKDQISSTREKLLQIAKDLGLTAMTDEEIRKLCDEIDERKRQEAKIKIQE